MVTALSLPQLWEGFRLSREARGVSDVTLATYQLAYQSLLRHLPAEHIENAQLITTGDLVAWLASHREWAHATLDQRIAKIKVFFRWLHQSGLLTTNPAADLRRPRPDWQPDPLRPDEISRLLEYARRGRNGLRNYAIVCLLLDSGIRSGELAALRRGDIVVKTGQLTVTGKFRQSRVVLVGHRTREALWRYLATRTPDDSPVLFLTETGVPFGRSVLRRLIANIGTEAGVADVHPHRLRHTFGVLYLRNRGDPYSLQALLGHKSMSTTRMYIKLAAQDVQDLYRSPLDALATQ